MGCHRAGRFVWVLLASGLLVIVVLIPSRCTPTFFLVLFLTWTINLVVIEWQTLLLAVIACKDLSAMIGAVVAYPLHDYPATRMRHSQAATSKCSSKGLVCKNSLKKIPPSCAEWQLSPSLML